MSGQFLGDTPALSEEMAGMQSSQLSQASIQMDVALSGRFRRHANPLNKIELPTVPHWPSIFRQQRPFALDIGCGEGLFTFGLAQQHPEWNVVGLEIREHLVASCLQHCGQLQKGQAHALLANANVHLSTLFGPESVAFVAINFPDPWYKQRHHKRRVIQGKLLEDLRGVLQRGAQIHIMTDYEPLARQAWKTFAKEKDYIPHQTPGTYLTQSSTGLASEREIKHLARKEVVFRLLFEYQAC